MTNKSLYDKYDMKKKEKQLKKLIHKMRQIFPQKLPQRIT